MKDTNENDKLSRIDPSRRVLLLAQCLRPSQTCPGRFNKTGLVCPENCTEVCVLGQFRKAALRLGYKGVCIAAGGAQSLRFVEENSPEGIVAVACDKELTEGIEAIHRGVKDNHEAPVGVIIPLTKDGCADTEIDVKRVLEAIALGCKTSNL